MDVAPAELQSSRNQLKSITPHIRDGPVERLSISDLPLAQNISPDVTHSWSFMEILLYLGSSHMTKLNSSEAGIPHSVSSQSVDVPEYGTNGFIIHTDTDTHEEVLSSAKVCVHV